jgi:hypothetical protein
MIAEKYFEEGRIFSRAELDSWIEEEKQEIIKIDASKGINFF